MKRILTYGTFDLLHYGHIRLLQRAKALVISKKSYNRSITSQSGNLDRKTVVCYGRNKR